MEKLPFELLSPIFSQLTQEDLINLPISITSKGLTNQELSSIFRIIDVWLDEKSLRSFVRAGHHPLISSRVQSIRFHDDRLAQISSYQFQARHGRHFGKVAPTSHVATQVDPCEMKLSWNTDVALCEKPRSMHKYRRYLELYEATEDLRAQKKDRALLVKGLGRFRFSPSIILDNHYGFSSQLRFRSPLGDAWFPACEGTPNRHTESHLSELLMGISNSHGALPWDLVVENTASSHQTFLGATVQSLPNVRLVEGWRRRWFPRRDTFRYLRKFCLRSCCNTDELLQQRGRTWRESDGLDRRNAMYLRLRVVLRDCKQLEDLERRLEGMPHLPLLQIFDLSRRRPPLRNLTLRNCKMTEPDLGKFLLWSAETLQTLRVTNLYLTQGSRVTLFELLGGELNLKSAVFDGLYQDGDTLTKPVYGGLAADSEYSGLPFPYKPDDEAALAGLCGRSDVNPYEFDTRRRVLRECERLGIRCDPYCGCTWRSDLLDRQFPSNIFTTIGAITENMGFPCWCWEYSRP